MNGMYHLIDLKPAFLGKEVAERLTKHFRWQHNFFTPFVITQQHLQDWMRIIKWQIKRRKDLHSGKGTLRAQWMHEPCAACLCSAVLLWNLSLNDRRCHKP